MRLGGLSYQSGTENSYRYNGKELHRELGLGWYDYGARMYDPAIGRWNGVDALAEDPNQIDKSPYAYAWNNPTNLTDPDGNCPICPFLVKGLIEGGIELGTQIVIRSIANDGNVVDAIKNVDWADVGVATVAGMAPIPGSGKAAVAARLAAEGTKALVDANIKDGLQTSTLIGGEKGTTETLIDATVGIALSSSL